MNRRVARRPSYPLPLCVTMAVMACGSASASRQPIGAP